MQLQLLNYYSIENRSCYFLTIYFSIKELHKKFPNSTVHILEHIILEGPLKHFCQNSSMATTALTDHNFMSFSFLCRNEINPLKIISELERDLEEFQISHELFEKEKQLVIDEIQQTNPQYQGHMNFSEKYCQEPFPLESLYSIEGVETITTELINRAYKVLISLPSYVSYVGKPNETFLKTFKQVILENQYLDDSFKEVVKSEQYFYHSNLFKEHNINYFHLADLKDSLFMPLEPANIEEAKIRKTFAKYILKTIAPDLNMHYNSISFYQAQKNQTLEAIGSFLPLPELSNKTSLNEKTYQCYKIKFTSQKEQNEYYTFLCALEELCYQKNVGQFIKSQIITDTIIVINYSYSKNVNLQDLLKEIKACVPHEFNRLLVPQQTELNDAKQNHSEIFEFYTRVGLSLQGEIQKNIDYQYIAEHLFKPSNENQDTAITDIIPNAKEVFLHFITNSDELRKRYKAKTDYLKYRFADLQLYWQQQTNQYFIDLHIHTGIHNCFILINTKQAMSEKQKSQLKEFTLNVITDDNQYPIQENSITLSDNIYYNKP